MNITERRRNGDWMALNGHWNVHAIQLTEWWLTGDWMAPFSFQEMVAFRLVPFMYKMHFLWSKTVWSASRCNCKASKIVMMTSYWQVQCDHIFALNLPWRVFRAINKHLIVSTYHFVLRLTPLYDLELLILFFPYLHVLLFLCDVTVNISWSD